MCGLSAFVASDSVALVIGILRRDSQMLECVYESSWPEHLKGPQRARNTCPLFLVSSSGLCEPDRKLLEYC